MKLIQSNGKFGMKVLGFFGIFAVSALTGAALTYIALAHQLHEEQAQTELANIMSDAGRCNLMLKQLRNGQTEYTKGLLSYQVASDSKSISSLSETTDPETRDFCKLVLANLSKSPKVASVMKVASSGMVSSRNNN